MCLPLGCLKCLVQFSAWITTLVGIGALIAAIILTVMEHSDVNNYSAAGIPVGHGLVTTFWIFTGIVLFFGLSGVIGGHKKISCLLFIYNIGNIAIGLAFLILAIVGFVIGAGWGNQQCGSDSWSTNLNQTYASSEQMFCHTGCECFVDNQEVLTQLNSSYAYNTTNSSLPQDVSGCAQFDSQNNTLVGQNNYFDVMETTFSCSGWCVAYPFYVFSNINNGLPEGNCYDQASQWLQDNGYLIGYIALSASCLIGLCILFTCCLCCHPEKKNEGNFYTRMAYYDGQ